MAMTTELGNISQCVDDNKLRAPHIVLAEYGRLCQSVMAFT